MKSKEEIEKEVFEKVIKVLVKLKRNQAFLYGKSKEAQEAFTDGYNFCIYAMGDEINKEFFPIKSYLKNPIDEI